MNKKAQAFTMNYILFVAIFLTVMGIISTAINAPIIQTIRQSNDNTSLIIQLLNFTDAISHIPVIGAFLQVILNTLTVSYVHPYLGMLYLGIFGIPLGFIVISLIRG